MMTFSLEDSQFRAILEQLGNPELIKMGSLALRSELHSRIAPYPPASEANRARKGKTHYMRGTGSVYTRKRGGRRVNYTSEMASRKWQMSVRGTSARLWNTASYSGYLWDARYQPPFHAKRGWKTVQSAWKAMGQDGGADEIIRDVLSTVIGRH